MSQLSTIFDVLSKDEISLWRKRELPKEGILFKQGEECSEVGLVSEGQLVISSYSYGGKEIVYSLIMKASYESIGELFASRIKNFLTGEELLYSISYSFHKVSLTES